MLGLKESPEVFDSKIQPPITENVKVMSMGFFYEQSQQAGIYKGPIIAGIVKQFITDVNWGELDYLIIDLPPGTGDAPLTMAQTIPITGILIVTTPQDIAMNVAVKSIGMFNKLNIPIVGVVENMSYLSCPNCHDRINVFGKGGGQKISEQFNIPFIGEIPLTSEIMQGSDIGKSIIISDPDSEYSQAFYKISKVTAGRISVVASELKDQDEREKKDKENEKIPQ